MAAFKNPEFYKAQAMRLPTFDKPRVISLSDETEEYLGLPRGSEDDLYNFLSSNEINFQCDDKTYSGKSISVEFNGELRGEQTSAVLAMLKYNNGVLSATTAFGKTVIGAKLIAERRVNTLIINDVINCVKEGRNPIVLTERTAHVKIIADALKEKLPNVITLTGGMTAKEKKYQIERISNIPKESNVVIVATGKFVGEGFDEPRLDTLFLAMPMERNFAAICW